MRESSSIRYKTHPAAEEFRPCFILGHVLYPCSCSELHHEKELVDASGDVGAQTDALVGMLSCAVGKVAAPADTSRDDRSGVQTRARDLGASVQTPMGTMSGTREIDGPQESVMTGILEHPTLSPSGYLPRLPHLSLSSEHPTGHLLGRLSEVTRPQASTRPSTS